MTDQRDEKFDEKDREKRDEKSPQEKSVEEKWERDPLSAIIWALILIWSGLVFLADNLGFLGGFQNLGQTIPGVNFIPSLGTWSIILIGAGLLVLLEALIRLVVPAYRRPVGGTIFFGVILIGIGLGNLINWSILFPAILIALGLSIIVRGVTRRDRS
jgi:hypothetical protein